MYSKFKTMLLVGLSISVFLSCEIDDSDDLQENSNLNCSLTDASANLNSTEINHLKQMREEEKLARDVYIKMYERYGLSVFNNISNSEQKHMDQVLCLLDYYHIDDPASETIGVFQNTVLQDLYDSLLDQGNISLTEALKVGATIEDVDIFDLIDFTLQTENQAIISIFENLTCGSRNHMRAFTKQLNNNGDTYTPQFIDTVLYNEIINATNEHCN
jgi:hypothetical protein